MGNFNEFLQKGFEVALPDAIALSPEEGGVVNIPAVGSAGRRAPVLVVPRSAG